MTATGNVEISTGQRRLLADEVRYDQRTDKMFAMGNVVLIEPNGDAIFGKEVEVTGDLQDGFVQAVGMLLKDDSRIAANRADRRGGNVIEFDRAVYSPCPLCDKEGEGGALWQIKARRVILDEKAETVTYRDARMELFGVPIAYTPWFRHPAPGVARQSGFLTPTFGSTSELGRIDPDSLLLRHRSELRCDHRPDLHPEGRHGARRRISAPAPARLHPAGGGRRPMPYAMRATMTASRATASAATSAASAATRSATTPRPASTPI